MAATQPNLVVNAVVKTDTRSLKKASKQISNFDKSVHKLGKTFLGVFAASKLAAYGKNAVMAFAADEKASKSLALQLKNTGNSFATTEVENYIAKLQKTTGVLDDQLRPAFSSILTATGSVTKAEQGLSLALDVAAGTGRDVETVSLALAKAYSGQTAGLSKLGAGISSTTLKSGNMLKITDELQSKFKGQAIEATKGYAGNIALLNVAMQNASETIGKGLLDALRILANDSSLTSITAGIEGVSNAIASLIVNVAKIASPFTKMFGMLTGSQKWEWTIPKITNPKPLGDRAIDAKIMATKKQDLAIQTALNTSKVTALVLSKDEIALAELKKKFDVERAGLQVALLNATDEETKARIRAQIQILDDSTKGAAATLANLNSQLAAAKATDALRTAMEQTALAAGSAAAVMSNFNPGNYLHLTNGAGTGTTPGNTSVAPISPTNVQPMTPATVGAPTMSNPLSNGDIASSYGLSGVTINLQSLDPSNALQVIQDGIQQLNRFGMNLTYAGSLGIN